MNKFFTLLKLLRSSKEGTPTSVWFLHAVNLKLCKNTFAFLLCSMLFYSSLQSQELIELETYLNQQEKANQTEKTADVSAPVGSAQEIKSQIFDLRSTIFMKNSKTSTYKKGPFVRLVTETSQLHTLSERLEQLNEEIGSVATLFINVLTQKDIEHVAGLDENLLKALPGLQQIFFLIGFESTSRDLDNLSKLLPSQEDSEKTNDPVTNENPGNQENLVYLYMISPPG